MTNEERDWADEKALSRREEMFRIPERGEMENNRKGCFGIRHPRETGKKTLWIGGK